jgi:hypothetical protein
MKQHHIPQTALKLKKYRTEVILCMHTAITGTFAVSATELHLSQTIATYYCVESFSECIGATMVFRALRARHRRRTPGIVSGIGRRELEDLSP